MKTEIRTDHDPIHIILADDDDDDRLFFRDAIKEVKLNTVVIVVNDGVELMECLIKPDIHLPNLIFLDLNMPRKSGIECLKEIRSNSKLKNISIAIYSTSALEKDIDETFINGANIYIKKPNDFEALKDILTKVITINWQYHSLDLNKENFLFNIQ
jgi:CheY-like chemotaxis protein